MRKQVDDAAGAAIESPSDIGDGGPGPAAGGVMTHVIPRGRGGEPAVVRLAMDSGGVAPVPDVAPPLPEPPLLLNARAAAALLGLGRSTFYRLDETGAVPRGVRIGRMRRWARRELEQWVMAGCPPRHRWEDRQRK